ncbi:hypothetical protein HK102_013519, partial [Quaeritorhiza haematococci]
KTSRVCSQRTSKKTSLATIVVDYSKWETLANEISDSSDYEDYDSHHHHHDVDSIYSTFKRIKSLNLKDPASKDTLATTDITPTNSNKLKLDPADLPQVDYETGEGGQTGGQFDSIPAEDMNFKLDLVPSWAYTIEDDGEYDRWSPSLLRASSHIPKLSEFVEGPGCDCCSNQIAFGNFQEWGGRVRYPGEGQAGKVAAYALQRIQEGAKEAHPYSKKYYTLHIRLRHTTRPIWRRVRVPGAMSLGMLHDKVICPVVGWVRNYHAYAFTLQSCQYACGFKPKNSKYDVGFGPVRARPLDMMHATRRRGGSAMVDDTRVCLADIVRRPGDCLKYVYDFGDQWEHLITVEKIQDKPKPGEKPFQVLGGIRACPPEDTGNIRIYMENLRILRSKYKTKKQTRTYLEKGRDVNTAFNYETNQGVSIQTISTWMQHNAIWKKL